MARVEGNFLQSGPSRRPCNLRFINRTSRKVNVMWADYGGYAISYGVLEPGRHFDIHSYEGHPWISEDTNTNTRMLLNGAKVFIPSFNESEGMQINQGIGCYRPLLASHPLPDVFDFFTGLEREDVYITLPVLSLVERSAETVAMNLRSREGIASLEIPTVLKDLLHSYFNPWL